MTTPLGENPYLYQGGPTVPLRQQRTGAYSANSFGNRVFYTPEGRLPPTTLAPNLAPTAGALLRQNLSGAGLAGAAIGGAIATQAAYSQGAGLFQGAGAGLGATVGAIGGQAAGAAAGSAVGGAAGSAVPVVGNVAGAGAGTVVGAVGGGLAGGAVGGQVGGGVGRALDDFFWPDPGEPAIGIPGQPAGASPKPARGAGTPAGALGAGPETVPGAPIYGPPLFPGGQMPGVSYLLGSLGNATIPSFRTDVSTFVTGPGPVSIVSQATIDTGEGGARPLRTTYQVQFANGIQPWPVRHAIGLMPAIRVFPPTGVPDTGGDGLGPQTGTTEPDRAPNPSRVPYRPRDSDGQLSPFARSAPTPTPGDRPWPEREAAPIPGTEPLGAPFRAPETAPGFMPMPAPEPAPAPAPTTAPTRPTDPFNPGPGGPLPAEDPERKVAPPFIPFMPFPGGVNPAPVQVPQVPVPVPNGFRQPATTPTGSPQNLVNPTTAPTTNPNVQPTPQPTPQPPRIEQGNCCVPPPDQEVLRRLDEIRQGVGTHGLPVSVPDQIAKQNPSQIQIKSLAELQLWQVQQLDGVMGRWPQQIPIPTPAGPINVGMPNMAEAVAEMVGMMVSQQVTATQILNTSSRTLVQAGSATQQAHLAHLVAKANSEFLGYESRPTQVDMPLAFTPGSDPFDGLLNESTQKIQGFENTDQQDFKSIVAELLQAAAIIRAVYWRKLDPKGDLRKQLKDQLRGQSDFIDQAAAGGGDDAEWEAYLRAVEEGFRGATGEANPYNRRPDEGPQIKDRSPDTPR